MYTADIKPEIASLAPYAPGLSIDLIREQYGCSQIIKLASNENPLGASPCVQEAIARHANAVFRYPRGGNPRMIEALAKHHSVPKERLILGNGSDEIIDLLIRILVGKDQSIVCCAPCFTLYPIQAAIAGVAASRVPLKTDFSFDFQALVDHVTPSTRLVFLTTPDNPSGYCPKGEEVLAFAAAIEKKAPRCLLVIDEAYMDFSPTEATDSLLISNKIPDNVAILRTFSKSYGMAGLRLGYGIVPEQIADAFWRTRLPFSVNILAEEAGLAALGDTVFHQKTLETVTLERARLSQALKDLHCTVWPSSANFLLFTLPPKTLSAKDCFEQLLRAGIIIRHLKGYDLPQHLRITLGNHEENTAFLHALRSILHQTNGTTA
ncbi:MAG: histidinol-phosphate transaminase [Desulfovibrio sp.]|nr:histidinol-phosphate transaminase [Desulfovibrio sp.]